MNNKAQVGIIGAIFLFMMFLLLWFMFLGGFIATTGLMIVHDNNLTGVEAFFFSNLNLVVFIGMILGMLGFMYFGAQTG